MHARTALIRLMTSRDSGFWCQNRALTKDLLHPTWPENLGITLPFYRPFAEAFEPDIPDTNLSNEDCTKVRSRSIQAESP
jgi:hypothetical protein